MKKRRYIIIAALILILAVIAYLILSPKTPKLKKVTLYKASAVASDVQFPYLAGPHTIDYFTGSSFAAYDTQTGTTSTISPQFALPKVDKVRWSSTGVLFRASGYTPVDDLYPVLVSNEVNTSQEYWWLYSFSTQQVTLLLPSSPSVQNINDAFWNNNGASYAYIDSNNNVYVSSDPSQPVYTAAQSPNIVQFSGNTLTLREGSTVKQVNVSNRKSSTVVNADQHLMLTYVSPDGQTIAYSKSDEDKAGDIDYAGDLYKVIPSTGKQIKLVSQFDGTISGTGGNLYASYTNDKGNVFLNYYPASGPALTFNLGAVLDRDATLTDILPFGTNVVYLDSSRHHLVRASTQAQETANPINVDYQIQTDLYLNGFEIHYFPNQDNYEIDIDSNPFAQYQNAALQYITSKGIDPNQLAITWRANQGVDGTNPHVDRTPHPGYATDPDSESSRD